MNRSTATSSRVKVDAVLSVVEAESLQKMLKQLTIEDCRRFTTNDAEAQICMNAAGKLRRHLASAEDLPNMPAYDD